MWIMTLSLVLSYAIATLHVPAPRTPAEQMQRWLSQMSRKVPLTPPWGAGTRYFYRRLELEKDVLTMRKGMIAFQERLLADLIEFSTPEQLAPLLRRLEADREELHRQETWVQALVWYELQRALNPDRETEDEAMERLEQFRRELWPPPRRGS
jgi:hypothetical protein